MDRIRTSRSLRSHPVRADWTTPSILLLQAGHSERQRPISQTARRRDLYGMAILWISENSRRASSRRTPGQSEESPKHYAGIGISWMRTWAQYISESTRAPKISVSSERFKNPTSRAGVEHGYHLHSSTRRLCLSDGCNRLVQSAGIGTLSVKQPGGVVLSRGSGAGPREVWSAGDFQHGPGSTIHEHCICECSSESWNPVEHGRTRTSSRQHLCREAVEIAQI